MGMYDIIDNMTVYCPQCGEIIKDEFQTKSFSLPMLNHYQVGDKIPDDRISQGYIEIHSICQNCRLMTTVYLSVENNILTDKFI